LAASSIKCREILDNLLGFKSLRTWIHDAVQLTPAHPGADTFAEVGTSAVRTANKACIYVPPIEVE
jgi:hypothetical protein